jgi:hypothetical protein
LQIAIYKNGQINAIWQIIKIRLYREFLQINKNGQIIAIQQISIYKNGQNATKYIILHLRAGSFRPI